MTNQPTTYTLTQRPTIGCYYSDEEGNPWCTFTQFGGTVPCADCGAAIGGGYSKGKLGEETFHCAEHVTIEATQYAPDGSNYHDHLCRCPGCDPQPPDGL